MEQSADGGAPQKRLCGANRGFGNRTSDIIRKNKRGPAGLYIPSVFFRSDNAQVYGSFKVCKKGISFQSRIYGQKTGTVV